MKPTVGKLIVFEGPDSVGKSTLSTRVVRRLRERGHDCLLLSFPGKKQGTLGKLVYDLHHSPQQFGVRRLGAAPLQSMHVAAHLDALENLIFPSLENGKLVILDRFWWSTVVYGSVFGIPPKLMRAIVSSELLAWGSVRPAVAFLIHREQPFNERRPDHTWKKLLNKYFTLAKSERRKYPVRFINNSEKVGDIVNGIVIEIEKVTEHQ